MKKLLLLLGFTLVSFNTQAQEPARRAAAPPPPLFFRESWKESVENVPVTQDFVLNPDLILHQYGEGSDNFGVTNEGGLAHIWTGNCVSTCALTLSSKTSLVDLSGKARIRWSIKTSGFHEVRPVLGLADGTWLIGDRADAFTFEFHESEIFLGEVRWLKLDMPMVRTKGTLITDVDLSQVSEIGFADLTPGSGHGLGGFSDVGWIEVYGKAVPRGGQ